MASAKPSLPPDPLPALPDPAYDGQLGPYAYSPLREVTGTRINPAAVGWYRRREALTSQRGVLSCAHPDLAGWLGDIRSFDPFTWVSQPKPSDWPLPAILPQITVTGNKLPFPLPDDINTYMIEYENLTMPGKLPDKPWVLDLKSKFPEDAQLILTFFGGKRELFWGLWTESGFWHHPFLDNFTAICLPDFSSFSDDPIPQSLLGERMQMIFAREGAQAGRTIIPKIAWRSEDSFRRQIELWVSQYPRVNTIMLNCYGHGIDRATWAWRWLYAIEKYCKGHDHIRWIIAGITQGWAIRELNEIFPKKNYSLLPSKLQFIAAQRKAVDPEVMAQRFANKMRHLGAYWSGEEIAEAFPKPTKWPTFEDAKLKLKPKDDKQTEPRSDDDSTVADEE